MEEMTHTQPNLLIDHPYQVGRYLSQYYIHAARFYTTILGHSDQSHLLYNCDIQRIAVSNIHWAYSTCLQYDGCAVSEHVWRHVLCEW